MSGPFAAGSGSFGYDPAVLITESLSKIYRTGAADVTALNAVSASFPAGKLTAIVGPSGSGKSTLLNLLAGFDTPSNGTVLFDGRVLSDLSEDQRCDLRLRSFGFVFQSYNLLSVLSAVQNVAFPMALAGVAPGHRLQRSRELLARFGLEKRGDHMPFKLSGGERQRVALARALANDPQVVFADEPTGNLDSRSGMVVLDALREVANDGRTVIIVTHDLDVAAGADERLELHDGEVFAATHHGEHDAERTSRRPEGHPGGPAAHELGGRTHSARRETSK